MSNNQVSNEFSLVCLHEHPELLLKCCKLLNDEWPRSETARLRSIEGSNPNLPLSLILIKSSNFEIVGHAKLSKLPKDPNCCWIESVVIAPGFRGKGLGRLLMDGCEHFAASSGFSTMFLSTHDQQGFYRKLGYSICEPICHFGSGTSRSFSSYANLNGSANNTPKNGFSPQFPNNKLKQETTIDSSKTEHSSVSAPPPPPMPKTTSIQSHCTIKTYMRKSINVPLSP